MFHGNTIAKVFILLIHSKVMHPNDVYLRKYFCALCIESQESPKGFKLVHENRLIFVRKPGFTHFKLAIEQKWKIKCNQKYCLKYIDNNKQDNILNYLQNMQHLKQLNQRNNRAPYGWIYIFLETSLQQQPLLNTVRNVWTIYDEMLIHLHNFESLLLINNNLQHQKREYIPICNKTKQTYNRIIDCLKNISKLDLNIFNQLQQNEDLQALIECMQQNKYIKCDQDDNIFKPISNSWF